MISQIFSAVQYLSLGTLFFGDQLFPMLGVNPPGLYLQARENKAWSAFLIFFVGGQFSNGLLTTGAFEVSYGKLANRCVSGNRITCHHLTNDQLLYSKLQTQQFPGVDLIVDLVQDALTSKQTPEALQGTDLRK
eukprot:c1803_g1_i1.p1 GENE.c1803_g1_i1~~c1803_g1_i1.p1  ORF type:complete len:134 (+),score=2.78 c1803_g1_i1:305-706(+)